LALQLLELNKNTLEDGGQLHHRAMLMFALSEAERLKTGREAKA